MFAEIISTINRGGDRVRGFEARYRLATDDSDIRIQELRSAYSHQRGERHRTRAAIQSFRQTPYRIGRNKSVGHRDPFDRKYLAVVIHRPGAHPAGFEMILDRSLAVGEALMTSFYACNNPGISFPPLTFLTGRPIEEWCSRVGSTPISEYTV